jgi:DNA invertase Pin-like site-specific DNA recombinase
MEVVMTALTRIYGYASVSMQDQGLSSDVQEALIRKRAAQIPDAKWAQCFYETQPATTPGYGDRPEFSKLMKMMPGNILIVCRLNQLDRSVMGAVACVKCCVDRGTRIIVLQHGGMELDFAATSGETLLRMMRSIALGFVELRREVTVEALQWRKANGFAWARPPFGFKTVAALKQSTERRPLKVYAPIDPLTLQEIVCRIDMGESPYAVSHDFMIRGVKCKGKLWARRKPSGDIDDKRVRRAYEFAKEFY